MARLGQVLREARATKGCSWQDIEEATGLWPDYVQALENEDYGKFSSVPHLRSCLRLYARYLGLNIKDIFALWEETIPGHPRSAETVFTPSEGFPYPTLFKSLTLCLLLLVLATMAVYGYQRLRSSKTGETAPLIVQPPQNAGATSPMPSPSPTPYLPIASTALPRYTMTVTLDYEGHRLDVEERIDYANRTGGTLQDIVLNVYPNHDPGVFVLHSLSLEFGKGPVAATHTLEGMTLRLTLPQELAPGQVTTLFLDFSVNLPYIDPAASFTAGSLGWSERAVDAGHWYPALAPYVPDEGWYTFPYHPVGDPYVMEEADYYVQISAAESVTVVGSGTAERDRGFWRYSIPQTRSFAFAASDEYLSHSVEVGGVTVTSYYFPEHEDAGRDVAKFAAEALETFGEQFAVRYPYNDYRVAEAEFAGGMEFSALSFVGSLWYDTYPGGVRSQLVSLLVHEVSHQWWYGLVGNDQVMEPWLDESLATFSGLLFYKLRYPDDHYWAWEFEVFDRHPAGTVDGSIYDFADQASYMNAVYRRGALFLADLRHAMGSEEFYAFLEDYCQSQGHKLSTTDDFFSILSRHTGEELTPLLEEYFTHEAGEGAS